MDERGQIHQFTSEAQRLLLEDQHGKLVEIPEVERAAVEALSVPDRKAWYHAHLGAEQKRARKEARKRQRAARKAQRRAW